MMKRKKNAAKYLIPTAMLALAAGSGCAVLGKKQESASGKDVAATGPTVVDVRTSPEEFKLNQSMQPEGNPEVLADVKDFTSTVQDVRLRFVRVPLELRMQHVAGSTWRARLTPDQLRTLAVSGKKMTYEANVIARNEDGQIAVSKEPVEIEVTAPDLAKTTG